MAEYIPDEPIEDVPPQVLGYITVTATAEVTHPEPDEESAA